MKPFTLPLVNGSVYRYTGCSDPVQSTCLVDPLVVFAVDEISLAEGGDLNTTTTDPFTEWMATSPQAVLAMLSTPPPVAADGTRVQFLVCSYTPGGGAVLQKRFLRLLDTVPNVTLQQQWRDALLFGASPFSRSSALSHLRATVQAHPLHDVLSRWPTPSMR